MDSEYWNFDKWAGYPVFNDVKRQKEDERLIRMICIGDEDVILLATIKMLELRDDCTAGSKIEQIKSSLHYIRGLLAKELDALQRTDI